MTTGWVFALCARYSDARLLPEVEVRVWGRDKDEMITVTPADEVIVALYKIERKDKSRVLLKA